MKALLMKDTLAQKPNLVLGALYSLIFFIAFGLVGDSPSSSFVYVISGIAVGFTVLLGSFKLDVNDTPRFMFSLPISRSTGVNEKFVLLVLGTLYGTVCAMVFGLVMSLPAIGWAHGLPTGLDVMRITSGMLVMTFIIPLYFRVGHTVIRYILVIGLSALVAGQVAAMLVISLRRGGGAIPFLDVLFGWIQGGGDLRRNLAIFAVGLGIAVISYVASHLIWRRREI